MATSNYLTKVAVVGAGGNSGRFMTEELLKTGKHTVTAITRADSQSSLPEGVIVRHVDYDKQETLVDALRGQDALVITISGRAPIKDVEEKLVRAAAEAGVPRILPNEWASDSGHEGLVKDVAPYGMKVETRKLIERIGKSSYIAVVNGFWYEWTLANPSAFGFDFDKRTITFFDDGEAKISVSTWSQIGRAVAALLNLPVNSEPSEASLEQFKNQIVYINSFNISQKDMFASVLRVTGTNVDEWTITKEPAQERFATGVREVKEGNMAGFSKFTARVFFPDGCGDFETNKGTSNQVLGLPTEDLDEATRRAIERQKIGGGH